jgi:hypothetical protein
MTGDAIHHYTLFDADSSGWGENKAYEADERPRWKKNTKITLKGRTAFPGFRD